MANRVGEYNRMPPDPIKAYLKEIDTALSAGDATEHTHRPALKSLLEALGPHVTATNEPRRTACGAPDFEVKGRGKYGPLTIGHIEAKDVDEDLGKIESDSNRKAPQSRNGKQFAGYRSALGNLILTNYLEFRWCVRGERRLAARLATLAPGGKLKPVLGGDAEVRQLLTLFLEQEPEPVADPKDLAVRMANLTHLIRDIIVEAFKGSTASAMLRDLHKAFEETLIPELQIASFADMFAQTLAYGLFAARCSDPSIRRGQFTRDKAAHLIPKTNPFLRRLFGIIAGPEMDEEPYEGHVSDLAQLLGYAEMDKVLANFGKREKKQDPVLHFYETFLAAYNPAERKKRGVYYTPEPVVSYIVRSVDHLLKTRFNCPDGLADTSTIELDSVDKDGNKVREKFPRVLILDPACGTGTFLYAIIDLIREKFMQEGNAGAWGGYVRDHLLPRLFGFELLMAPYAVAHFKLGMQLAGHDLPSEELRKQWAYDFSGHERLGIYLTNALERMAQKREERTFVRFLDEESRQAADVKERVPIMVVLGNPPYAGLSANRSWKMGEKGGKVRTFIGEILRDYYFVDGEPLGERKVWLQDDYVKFIRFGQWRIERTGAGILAFITNHGYLDNPTFRGMRQQLMRTFDEIYVLDLHGNKKKKETCPDGSDDQNVFEIQQGVAIGIFLKLPGGPRPGRRSVRTVSYADLWGVREVYEANGQERALVGGKCHWLRSNELTTTLWLSVTPRAPFYSFRPEPESRRREYESGRNITEAMGAYTTGIVTARDRLVFGFRESEILQRIGDFGDERASDDAIRHRYFQGAGSSKYPEGDTRGWKLALARAKVVQDTQWRRRMVPCQYRPFDVRPLYYVPWMVDWPRPDVMRHMLAGPNVALISARSNKSASMDHFLTTRLMAEAKCGESTTQSALFPLYLYPAARSVGARQARFDAEARRWPAGKHGRRPNLNPEFVAQMQNKLSLNFLPDGLGDLSRTFGPEDVFHYIYAIFHSPTYRKRYAEFLKRDFPRVPLTSDLRLFRELCQKGADLVALHLVEGDYAAASWNRAKPPEASPFQHPVTRYPIAGDDIVEKVFYVAPGEPEPGTGKPLPSGGGRVYISKDRPAARPHEEGKKGQYFEGVPPEVWAFHVGGYQVCEKWLKDRKGRKLSYDDIQHYHKIVVALNETIRLMDEIDAVMPKWPVQ